MGRKKKECPRLGCGETDCMHCKCTAPDCDHQPGGCNRERVNNESRQVTCRHCKSIRDRVSKKRKMPPSLAAEVGGDDVTFDLTELAGDGLDVLASAEIGNLRRLQALHQAAECDFGAVNEDGENAFMLAANNGHMHVLGWMAEVGIADYTSRDNQGRTALVFAAREGHLEVVKWLVGQGVDPCLATHLGCTPLLSAAFSGSVRLLEYLSQFQDLSSVGEFGQNPLHYAATNGRLPSVRWLLQQPRVDATVKNTDGLTARDLASRAGHKQVIKLLDAHAIANRHAPTDAANSTKSEYWYDASQGTILPAAHAQRENSTIQR